MSGLKLVEEKVDLDGFTDGARNAKQPTNAGKKKAGYLLDWADIHEMT